MLKYFNARRRNLRGWALACVLLSCTSTAQALDLRDIEARALAHARQQTAALPGRVEISTAILDRAVQLPACARTEAFTPPNMRLWGNSVVGVRCVEGSSWSIQIPVNVRVFAPVVVTARAIGRHQVLTQADLAQQTMDLTRLPLGLLTELEQAVGKRTVAALPAAAPLRGDMLRAPIGVEQGQSVQIIYRGQGFQVKGEGRSMSNASIGESVRVRTPSGKILKGVVVETGVVQVQ